MRIVSWNVNGLYTTLKDAAARYSSVSNYFSHILKADIVCFQEAKIQEDKLEKWMACVNGYDSHWAFSQEKKGYSGVVTYVKEEMSPLDAKADWLVEDSTSSTEGLSNEGRLIYTDHGSFVLLNVYVPNAGDHDEGRPRLEFKLRYLKALEQTCDDLVRSGRHFVIVGDFNVAHKDIDVHARWKIEECYSLEERQWIGGFVSKYVDLYRHFHPDARDVYSVWNQKTEARIHNEGFRIDYAFCDKGLLSEVSEADIEKMVPKKWSDHAAVMLLLKDQPSLQPHPAPALSSRNMKRFHEDPRQKKLTALFNKGPKLKASDDSLKSGLLSASAIKQLDVEQEVSKHSGIPNREGNPSSMGSTESPDTEATKSSVSASREVSCVPETTEVAITRPQVVSRLGNNATVISGSTPSQGNKHSSSQMKSKGQSVVGKRKIESDSKGSNSKQRSVVSFFKATNNK